MCEVVQVDVAVSSVKSFFPCPHCVVIPPSVVQLERRLSRSDLKNALPAISPRGAAFSELRVMPPGECAFKRAAFKDTRVTSRLTRSPPRSLVSMDLNLRIGK